MKRVWRSIEHEPRWVLYDVENDHGFDGVVVRIDGRPWPIPRECLERLAKEESERGEE